MKSATRSRFPNIFPGVSWEWFIIDNPFGRIRPIPSDEIILKRDVATNWGAREVKKHEAVEYIEENGLVLAYESKDGKIWDTPGGDFKKRFHIKDNKESRKIDEIWG